MLIINFAILVHEVSSLSPDLSRSCTNSQLRMRHRDRADSFCNSLSYGKHFLNNPHYLFVVWQRSSPMHEKSCEDLMWFENFNTSSKLKRLNFQGIRLLHINQHELRAPCYCSTKREWLLFLNVYYPWSSRTSNKASKPKRLNFSRHLIALCYNTCNLVAIKRDCSWLYIYIYMISMWFRTWSNARKLKKLNSKASDCSVLQYLWSFFPGNGIALV